VHRPGPVDWIIGGFAAPKEHDTTYEFLLRAFALHTGPDTLTVAGMSAQGEIAHGKSSVPVHVSDLVSLQDHLGAIVLHRLTGHRTRGLHPACVVAHVRGGGRQLFEATHRFRLGRSACVLFRGRRPFSITSVCIQAPRLGCRLRFEIRQRAIRSGYAVLAIHGGC